MPQFAGQKSSGHGGRRARRGDSASTRFPHEETEARIRAFVGTDEWCIPTLQTGLFDESDTSTRRFAAGSAMKNVLAELQRLTTLENDWDGYGAPAVASSTVVHVMAFLYEVASPGVPAPVIVVTGRSMIQIEWHRDRMELDVEIDRDGAFEATYEGPDGRAEWSGDPAHGVPPELARCIVQLAGVRRALTA
jgi:hypothetical protein